MVKKLAVIDGKSIFYRGYYAMPSLSMADGTPTGGVFGFASLAIELIKRLEPDYVAVAWDKPKTNVRKRLAIYPEYKAGRKPAPADFYAQVPILKELLAAFDWPFYEIDDYEADDILGAFARQATERGIETDLLTSDLDALQLIGPLTKVYALKNGLSNIEEFDIKHFEQKYGIRVDQFLDFKSLKGDSSDNLPGVPGIGEKTAAELLQRFDTLAGIYAHLDDIKPSVVKKLVDGKESASITKRVARIWTDVPVQLDWDIANIRDIDLVKVAEILKRLEFHSLVRRLPTFMRANPKQESLLQTSDAVEAREVGWSDAILSCSPLFIYTNGDTLWITGDGQKVAHQKIDAISTTQWKIITHKTVVTYDGKDLYHQLAACGVMVRFSDLYDERQAAFLINSLQRDRSLEGLVGGELTTTASRTAALATVYNQQKKQLATMPRVEKIARTFDFPLIYHLFMMEYRGITIDPTFLKNMSQQLSHDYNKLEQEIYKTVGYEFNIGSPSQLSQVLFTKLQLPTTGIKKGKTNYSTDQKSLDKLRGQHPIIELIERTRELAKLRSTYVDALPKLADKQNRIHTTYNQDVAATGRLSSTNPNLQNIPVRSDLGRKIREAFVPSPGHVFVNADYSQFELRLAAVLAGDSELINDFNGGVDVHTKTAARVYGVPMDAVTKDQRRHAKVINFGVLYGMSPHGLAEATGMSFLEAKKFIDHYFELRAPIRKYLDATLEQAKTEGYVETYFGRRRPTPDVLSSNFMVRESAKRAAANMPIQGTEADLMKRAMIQVDDKLGGLGEQIVQVHDSILVECRKEDAIKVSEILRTTMEQVAPELPIQLSTETQIGNNWGEL